MIIPIWNGGVIFLRKKVVECKTKKQEMLGCWPISLRRVQVIECKTQKQEMGTCRIKKGTVWSM